MNSDVYRGRKTTTTTQQQQQHLAVAGDVFDGVFFVLSFLPLDVLGEIWDLIESVSEGFPTYSCKVSHKF